jgi:transcriptional regulator of acetoin/glycerol metabolism
MDMPRVHLTEAQRAAERWRNEDKEIRGRIGEYLAVTGRNVGQLALRIGMTQETMYRRMKAPGTFRLDEYRRLMDEIGKAVVMP